MAAQVAAKLGAEVGVAKASQTVLVAAAMAVVETVTHSHSRHLDSVVPALQDSGALCRIACGCGACRSSLRRSRRQSSERARRRAAPRRGLCSSLCLQLASICILFLDDGSAKEGDRVTEYVCVSFEPEEGFI